MAKRTLREALEALQEHDPINTTTVPGSDNTGARGPNPMKFNPRSWRTVTASDSKESGPWNAQGRGQGGIGRGGVGWGGRPDDSGGIREPSSTYTDTWDTQDEGADWDELDRHGEPRNLWRDAPDGKQLRANIEDDQVEEAMGVPFNQSMAYGHAGNMTGGTGPGMTVGWNRSPNLGDEDEDDKMKLREFFDPSPIQAEEIDNPEQDKFGDSTDDEMELGDEDGMEVPEPEEMEDMGETEPGDGQDLGGPETLLLMPKLGQNDFVMSPDKMGAARGTYGMHSDGAGASSMTDKSSAWDVLKKVVDALGNEEEPLPLPQNPLMGGKQ